MQVYFDRKCKLADFFSPFGGNSRWHINDWWSGYANSSIPNKVRRRSLSASFSPPITSARLHKSVSEVVIEHHTRLWCLQQKFRSRWAQVHKKTRSCSHFHDSTSCSSERRIRSIMFRKLYMAAKCIHLNKKGTNRQQSSDCKQTLAIADVCQPSFRWWSGFYKF